MTYILAVVGYLGTVFVVTFVVFAPRCECCCDLCGARSGPMLHGWFCRRWARRHNETCVHRQRLHHILDEALRRN
jgi:hypothetical protein